MSARPWPPRDDDAYREAAHARLDPGLAPLFAGVRALVLDCDGVMTDGSLLYGPDGEALKAFDVRDGLGLVLARAGGLKLALLTGRHSAVAERRVRELKFDALRLGRFDKQAALLEILAELDVPPEAVLYMGDDLIDIPALDLVGLPVTVPAACSDVRDRCRYVTEAPGGAGAVREVAELALQCQGRFGPALVPLAEKAWLPQTGGRP